MSFPGSGIEITYRNDIDEVNQFLQERHDSEFRIYNLSGIQYNYAKLQNKVHDYPWEDHHSPPMDTLFRLCQDMDEYLSQDISNVVIIHCLAGKGRTGTVICCYLLYSGRFKRADQALDFYMKKRFRKGGGVTQPSQRRYVYYFHQIMNQTNHKIYPSAKYINRIEVDGIPKVLDHKSCRPFIEVYDVGTRNLLYSTKEEYNQQKEYLEMNDPSLNKMTLIMKETSVISGDILFRLFDQNKFSINLIGRFAFNTAFLTTNEIEFNINQIDPDKIQKDPRFPTNFSIKVVMDDYCECQTSTSISDRCSNCQPLLQKENIVWTTIYQIMDQYKQRDLQQSQILLFGYLELDDVSDILFAKGDFQTKKTRSNIEQDDISE